MKHKSVPARFAAAVLCCIFCCAGLTSPKASAEEAGELPVCFDWREEAPEILTPVKKQIGGTCWAYATIACAEANLIKKGLADSSIDLSEAHLIWFTNGQGSPTDPDDLRYGGTHNDGVDGYEGGASVLTTDCTLAAWQGVVPESAAAPHADKQPLDESLRYQSVAHLQNAEGYPLDEPQIIKTKLMENGPMVLSYFNSHDQEDAISAQHGYYNQDYLEKKEQDALNGDFHLVMLVGWDDSFSKENFTAEPPGDGAWILRDSQAGRINSGNAYYYMSYYEPSIRTYYSYDFEPVTNYGNVYHYNDSEITRYSPSKEENGFLIANVFEAAKPEKIAAVGFFTDTRSEAYEISVYALEDGFRDPQDGTLVTQFDGVVEFRGFHTVQLPQTYAVEPGQLYSVVIRLPVGKQYGTYFDSAVYREGVSFRALYNSEGVIRWKDCYDLGRGDVCIHVYTKYEDETEDYIRGDLNRDGTVSAADLSLLKQLLYGSQRTDLCLTAADWNGDGLTDAADASGLRDFLLGDPAA